MIDVLTVANSIAGCVPGDDASTLELPCTKHPGKGLCVQLRVDDDKLHAASWCGCKEADLLAMLAEQSPAVAKILSSGAGASYATDGAQVDVGSNPTLGPNLNQGEQTRQEQPQNKDGISDDSGYVTAWQANGSPKNLHTFTLDEDGPPAYPNGTNGHLPVPHTAFTWKMRLYDRAKAAIERFIKENPESQQSVAAMDLDAFRATVEKQRNVPDEIHSHDPSELNATEIEEELHAVAVAVQKVYAKVSPQPKERPSSIVDEDAEQAVASNAEYLSRSALVDQLLYTHHASLHVGGKHEGKTTATKTDALALAVGGCKLYGRESIQTPVIYAASEDEYPSVRMDLLRMGWNPAVPLKMVKIADNADRDFVLEDIAKLALKMGAYFVVLDMLFDFTQIQDELKYAHTREATGKVIQLAVAISGHVKATHHSPKWMPDAASAGKAALGSQGIAARFSPILLSKMWVAPKVDDKGKIIDPGLYTVESTMTRDPRGRAVPVTQVQKNDLGWAVSEKEFKNWMKWPLYVQRIIDLYEMSEPGKRFTVNAVAEALQIPKPETQNAMLRMTQGPDARLERMKLKGNSFTYGLIGVDSYGNRESQETIWERKRELIRANMPAKDTTTE